MKTVRLTGASFKKVLSLTERTLRSGGVVVAPTDTVYGLLGDATRAEVVRKIFVIKQRPEEKALLVFVKDIATARHWAYISDIKAKFLEKVWPGSVTVLFQHKEKLPKILTGGTGMLGMRIPNHPFILDLLSRLEFPFVQTSANVSGKPPAQNVKEIKEYFGKKKIRPDLVIDGGELNNQVSAMVDFTGKEPITIRSGLVTKEELDHILGGL